MAENIRDNTANIASFDTDLSLIIADGQSLEVGVESYPPLTIVPRYEGSMMMGASVRPDSGSQPEWKPQGMLEFQPLKSTVERRLKYNQFPLSEIEYNKIPYCETVYAGECPIIAASQMLAVDTRGIVVSNVAVTGTSIEQHLPGAKPLEHFQRLRGAVDAFVELSRKMNKTCNVVAIKWQQGQDNSVGYGTSDKEKYKEYLDIYYRSAVQYIRNATGQAKPPAIFVNITSGGFLRDRLRAAICLAQVEFAKETPGAWCLGPDYPVTNKGGHLDSNGSRWLGCNDGKVMRQVLKNGVDWKPIFPNFIFFRKSKVVVDYQVPYPPLRFSPVFMNTRDGFSKTTVPTEWFDKGYLVEDERGFLKVKSVTILEGTKVEIDCERELVGDAWLWYADRKYHRGTGNICDSDKTTAPYCYEFISESGMHPAADIPELVGKPYDLSNWCSPFCLPISRM